MYDIIGVGSRIDVFKEVFNGFRRIFIEKVYSDGSQVSPDFHYSGLGLEAEQCSDGDSEYGFNHV